MNIDNLSPGQNLGGFSIEKIDALPVINATMVRLVHRATGARFMHLERDDDNHLFAVGFRTPPEDSTGIAHILEHTALCGSQRFPVRDPFFTMLKRSLNSFMNALTASDWTLYPFSSTNHKDFHNLLEIYLDAAFFPRLTERDFSQEGHRLEFAEADNPQSPLEYKGVVYNEMKGAMSDPSSLLSRRVEKYLYPTTTYHYNSGGEPDEIPELTWQQLRDFHARYYHPSNAWFFTAGNLELSAVLERVEERVLCRFERLDLDSRVALEQRLSEPQRVIESYPLDAGEPLEKRSLVQLAWLGCDVNDSFERLAFNLLSALLLGNPAAPLYKALLDSGLGANLAPGSGYHDENRTTHFAVGLQGTDSDQLEAIERLVLNTLKQVADEGFSQERVEAAIHRLEIANREVSGDSFPYSLLLLMRMLGPWIHGGDPLEALSFDQDLARLRDELAAGPFFENLIRSRLLDNPHRLSLLLKPDPELGPWQEAETRKKLDCIANRLQDEDREQLVERARELQQAQEAPEDLSCLPTLELSDIAPEESAVSYEQEQRQQRPTYWFDQPTNGIAVVSLNFSVAGLSAEQLSYLPVFSSLLTQMGAGERDYLQMAERLEAVTGGIAARGSLLDSPNELDGFTAGFELKGKALIRNVQPLFELLRDFLIAPDFSDLEQMRRVLNQLQVALENSVPQSGHTYAARRAAASLTPAAQLREQWSGLSQVALVRRLAAQPAEQLAGLAETFKAIASRLFQRSGVQTAVTVEGEHFPPLRTALDTLLGQLPQGEAAALVSLKWEGQQPSRQGIVWSVPVNYVTRVSRATPYNHADSAALMVLAKLLRAEFLHREIREKGGAYGGLASYNPESGLFSMLSYRDPQLQRTLQVYEQAVAWAVAGDYPAEAVKESILAVFSDLDKPLSPAGVGAQEFANIRQGLTLDMRNRKRQQLLAVKAVDLQSVAERYLLQGQAAVSVLAGESALQQANQQLDSEPLEIRKV